MQNGSMRKYLPYGVVAVIVIAVLAIVLIIINQPEEETASVEPDAATAGEVAAGLSGEMEAIAAARGLTPDDISAALKTYMPSGRHDDYIMFSSGGHAGQIFVIGMPSMRLLKTIAVFTPEPWQGYGYGAEATMEILEEGTLEGYPLTWGDTHHPALSETAGDYDGEFVFINDKANARVAVIDLLGREANHDVYPLNPDLSAGLEHISQHRPTADLMQHLRQLRVHPRAAASRQDYRHRLSHL